MNTTTNTARGWRTGGTSALGSVSPFVARSPRSSAVLRPKNGITSIVKLAPCVTIQCHCGPSTTFLNMAPYNRLLYSMGYRTHLRLVLKNGIVPLVVGTKLTPTRPKIAQAALSDGSLHAFHHVPTVRFAFGAV
jgi:hypothetical protein